MKQLKSKPILKSNDVRVELTSSADDNEDAPNSLMLLPIERKTFSNVKSVNESQINPRFKTVRDELTFNADDNEHISESPM